MGGRKQRAAELSKAANSMQNGQARSLDALSEYESFREMFVPEIRKALLDGLTEKQIMEKFKPLVTARLVQIGATGRANDAIAAIKEMYDRLDGKARQAVDHTHKLAKLPESEIDAILQSKLKRLGQGVVDITPAEEDEE